MELTKEGKTTVVRLPERFAGEVVKHLRSMVKYAADEGLTELTVDLGATAMIDSAGIGTLASVAWELRQRNGTLTLRNLSPEMESLVEDTGLGQVLPVEGRRQGREPSPDGGVDVKLEIQTETRDNVFVMHLCGVLGHPVGSNYFREQLLLAMEEHRDILLDMTELTFFDSLSVGVLVEMGKLMAKTGGTLRVCGANDIVKDLFSTLNIHKVVPSYDTLTEALRNWKSP